MSDITLSHKANLHHDLTELRDALAHKQTEVVAPHDANNGWDRRPGATYQGLETLRAALAHRCEVGPCPRRST
jgi:hypothetical protein